METSLEDDVDLKRRTSSSTQLPPVQTMWGMATECSYAHSPLQNCRRVNGTFDCNLYRSLTIASFLFSSDQLSLMRFLSHSCTVGSISPRPSDLDLDLEPRRHSHAVPRGQVIRIENHSYFFISSDMVHSLCAIKHPTLTSTENALKVIETSICHLEAWM